MITYIDKGYPLSVINRELTNIPEVRAAIDFNARTVARVPFYHKKVDRVGNSETLNGRYDYLLNVRANPYQTPEVFWRTMISRKYANNNSFALTIWRDDGYPEAIYPLPFTLFELTKDTQGNVVINFFNGQNTQPFYYSDIIHLQRFPNGKYGDNKLAVGNYTQILTALQDQAVKDTQLSGKIAAVVQSKGVTLTGDKMKKKLDEFKENFLTTDNTTGIGFLSGDYQLTPIDLKTNPIDSKLLSDITNRLLNYLGSSEKIINMNASEIEYEQYIDGTIKSDVLEIEQELTYKWFSNEEIYKGNQISAELIDVEVSSLSAKTTFFDKMLYHGVVNPNEVRKQIGLSRGGDELDVYRTNLNSIETKQANNYQLN